MGHRVIALVAAPLEASLMNTLSDTKETLSQAEWIDMELTFIMT